MLQPSQDLIYMHKKRERKKRIRLSAVRPVSRQKWDVRRRRTSNLAINPLKHLLPPPRILLYPRSIQDTLWRGRGRLDALHGGPECRVGGGEVGGEMGEGGDGEGETGEGPGLWFVEERRDWEHGM